MSEYRLEVATNHLRTGRYASECLTSLLLKVVTKRNFIADFLRENPIFYTKNGHFAFFCGDL